MDLPKLAPVPRRSRSGRLKRPMETAHEAGKGNICIYVLGADGSGVSKIGVSRKPYLRMSVLSSSEKVDLMMCYFAEVPRQVGFEIESAIKQHCQAEGLQVKGEWINYPRHHLTAFIRDLFAERSISPIIEVGDTGDGREKVLYEGFIKCRLASTLGPRATRTYNT